MKIIFPVDTILLIKHTSYITTPIYAVGTNDVQATKY